MLKQGDKSGKVRELQEFLNAQGERLQTDGNFGPMTKAAVQRFQGKHGLTADGLWGSKSEAARQALLAGKPVS